MKLFLASVAFLAAAQAARADLRAEPRVIELGTIPGGAPLQATFVLKNAGTSDIEILEVNRGCDCLEPRLDNRVLGAGARATLVMDIRTLGHSGGPHTWTASVRYREGTAMRDLPLALHADIKNEVTVEPAVCAMFVANTLRQIVTLTDARAAPLSVTRAEVTAPAVKVDVERLPGGVTKIVLEATGANLAPGRRDEMLSIYTNDPLYAHLRVPVTLIRAMEPAVTAVPHEVHYVVDTGKSVPATLIRLRARGDASVGVVSARADDPTVTCSWAAGPGTGATLKIQVGAARTLDTLVRVHLRAPAPEILSIPVQVKLR